MGVKPGCLHISVAFFFLMLEYYLILRKSGGRDVPAGTPMIAAGMTTGLSPGSPEGAVSVG
jgi:hypothetical protein